ncbi:glycosyltransferase family 9 protein [Mesorhizobium sp. ES1-1]|uniref:glycosyltransferase family 9 protein n=1 Tax=Mesorhizobium sp. ES1-1 TaxID=2876629 RepID=UPI001CCD59D5|nr:glycosyltransferase family 9 protein [Mesorhizobium sp. ES1-1]MBZ9674710.1 glycosyltransferase family 9 protein [Mesorhizobium sp. ES1-1]
MQISPMRFSTILVIQTKFIGDIVLASVLAENLRLAFPGSKLVFLCEARTGDFVLAHRIASDVVTFKRASTRGTVLERAKELYTVVRELRRFRFDLTIDITDSKTSRFIAGLINAKTRVGYNPPERPLRLFERQPANLFARPYGFGGKHFVYRYLSPLEALGVKLNVTVPNIQPLPAETEYALTLLQKHDVQPRAFIAVHAGASFEGRRWQPERFAAAIRDIVGETGLNVVLVGGPEEGPLAEQIIALTGLPLVNLVGQLSLESLLAVLKQARLFLGNESGPMHMAAAAGTPVVGLYGYTSPIRWGPLGVRSIALQPSMPCVCIAPDKCSTISSSKVCCVWRVEVPPVVEAVRQLLSDTEQNLEPIV